MKYLKYFSLLLLIGLVSYCASNYIEKVKKAEDAFYKENYDTAIPELRALAKDKDIHKTHSIDEAKTLHDKKKK